MCGRARLSSDVSEIKLVFSIPPDRATPNIAPSWNVVPTDPLPVVGDDTRAGERSLDVMRWAIPCAGRRMMSEANSANIRKAYEDFARGNIPAVFAAFDAAITWHVPGHSPLSGDFKGHDQIGDFFQRTMGLAGGAFSIDVHNILADGDLVVALVTVNARREGISESFPEVHVWRMKNGKAIEFREYQGDEQREDRFWS